MSDFERINGPRVQKIIDMLEVIAKSARSNKVHEGLEHVQLLKPIFDHLTATGCDLLEGEAPTPETPAAPCSQPDTKYPPRTAQEILEGLSPQQLISVAYVALMRIDEDVYASSLQRQP